MGDYFISGHPVLRSLLHPLPVYLSCIMLFYIPDFQFSLLLNEQSAANNRKMFYYLPGIPVFVFANGGTDTGR